MAVENKLNADSMIYEAIRKIALHKYVNRDTGAFIGTEKITGFVVKVHDQEEDEFYGTIDVQEYGYIQEEGQEIEGLHVGVMLTPTESNATFVWPTLMSDVVISIDPGTGREYASVISHTDENNIDSHQKVSIGVTETEKYNYDDVDSEDIDDLPKTGNHSHTTYTKESINHTVETGDGNGGSELSSSQIISTNGIVSNVGNQSTQTITKEKAVTKSNKIALDSSNVSLGGENATHPAVLGDQLATLLIDILDTMTQVLTATQIGPQPPQNVAKFAALKAKVNAYKSAVSGILTKKVKVQE